MIKLGIYADILCFPSRKYLSNSLSVDGGFRGPFCPLVCLGFHLKSLVSNILVHSIPVKLVSEVFTTSFRLEMEFQGPRQPVLRLFVAPSSRTCGLQLRGVVHPLAQV